MITEARQSLPTIHAHIDAVRLSDLFFNHEHPQFDSANARGEDVTRNEAKGALLTDAFDFVQCLTGVKDEGLAVALVNDFFERL